VKPPSAPLLCIFCALILGAWLLSEEHARSRLRRPGEESCLACHTEVTDPGPSHTVKDMGCSPCHLGNPYALDRERAHQDVVANPGALHVAGRTCGATPCHPELPGRVINSVMSTNHGIIDSMDALFYSTGVDNVAALTALQHKKAPARDCFAKLCGSCHLWTPRRESPTEAGQRGGGCSGCHVVQEARDIADDLSKLTHAEISTRIPIANCVRCHNRSARVGLTYQGILEDDGYGTPFKAGLPSPRRLSGGRHYLEIPSDVHFRAEMVCIDCHTSTEVMGDGRPYANLKGQLEITCQDCHSPTFRKEDAIPEDAVRLARSNGKMPEFNSSVLARARKGSPLYALRPAPDHMEAVLYRKLDGMPLRMELRDQPAPHHALPGHERLSCQACHSWFMPQCYGCHLELHKGERQFDHLLGKETPGRWREARSFTRFMRPPLALDKGSTVAPFSPCQIRVSVFDEDGRYLPSESPARGVWTSFDPHSTQKGSRSCADCHLQPKSLGLGSGEWEGGRLPAVTPVYDAPASWFVSTLPPEQVAFSTSGAEEERKDRAFQPSELCRILFVAPCLPCHDSWDDPVYTKGFRESLKSLAAGTAKGCLMPVDSITQLDPVQCDNLSQDTVSYETASEHVFISDYWNQECNHLK
jgi:hypothetical protein